MALQQSVFQLTAARRRLASLAREQIPFGKVSTHSRPKAAGGMADITRIRRIQVSTHSRPKAAGEYNNAPALHKVVSTHSRPKAAGWEVVGKLLEAHVSTHSRPKAAG